MPIGVLKNVKKIVRMGRNKSNNYKNGIKSEGVFTTKKRPLGIALIAILHYIFSISSIFSVNESFPILGITLNGVYAPVLWIILAVVCFLIGYGLWKLKLFAWWLVIGLNISSLLYGMVYYINLFLKDYTLSLKEVTLTKFLVLPWYIVIIIMTVYLFKRKFYFLKLKTT